MPGNNAVQSALGLLLSLILCVSGTDLIGSPGDVSTPDSSFSVVLCAPPSVAPPVVRAKADKTPFTGCLEAPEGTFLHHPIYSSELDAARESDRPGLILESVPLASRPPPLA